MVYKTFEHTADIGLEVEAANLNWAFAEAALGLTTVITGGNIGEPVRYPEAGERIELEGEDLETLLVRWLSEIVFLFDTEDFLVGAAKTTLTREQKDEDDGVSTESWKLTGRLLGEPFDKERHGYGAEVKAVTYHDIEVVEGPPGTIRVIFDL